MMLELFGIQLGTPFQGGAVVVLILIFGGMVKAYIKGIADRLRASNERDAQDTKAATEIRDEYALRYRETRLEIHALRNELQAVRGELADSQTKSVRRSDKLNMVLFILRMVMDELHAQDPKNKVLSQANILLARIEDEPHDPSNSDALTAAENTVDAAIEAVHEVKASEAKKR